MGCLGVVFTNLQCWDDVEIALSVKLELMFVLDLNLGFFCAKYEIVIILFLNTIIM